MLGCHKDTQDSLCTISGQQHIDHILVTVKQVRPFRYTLLNSIILNKWFLFSFFFFNARDDTYIQTRTRVIQQTNK